jgi:hypothetical protein
MKHPRLLLLLCIAFLVPHLATGEGDSVQVDADLSGAAVFIDNTFVGNTPVTISGLTAGNYRVAATVPGHFPQVKNITVPLEGAGEVFFSFGSGFSVREPGMIKIHDCASPPELTGMSGTSISVVTLPDGEIMAYYSGRGEGVQCAGSKDGSGWYEYPEGCLEVSGSDTLIPLSRPWVYPAQNGGYRMIYLTGDMGSPSLLGAFSVDGKRFTQEGEVTIHNQTETDPEFPEQRSIPTGIRLADGSLRMYYSPLGGGIKSAVSSDDGKTWSEEEGYRLDSATDPTAIMFPDGRFGLFFVDLSSGSKGQKIRVALSRDGLLFTTPESGIIIESDQKGQWILDPDIHPLPDGGWMLFFSVMGTPGEAGITVPSVMKTVIDPDCLVAQEQDNNG